MKINNATNPHLTAISRNRPDEGVEADIDASESAQRAGDTQERVLLSDAGKELADVKLAETPDQERITRLREAIENGTFEIDPTRIAERMLDEEL